MGSGKTATITYLGLRTKILKEREIVSNYPVKFMDKMITKSDEMLSFEGKNNLCFLLDELHFWLDARTSSSKKNRILSSFLMGARRYLWDVFYTEQYFTLTDKRLREITDLWAFPKGLYPFVLPNGEMGFKKFKVDFTTPDGMIIKTMSFNNNIFKMFNSFEDLSYLRDE